VNHDCGGRSRVLVTWKIGPSVWRERICLKCGERFTTQEVETVSPFPKSLGAMRTLTRGEA